MTRPIEPNAGSNSSTTSRLGRERGGQPGRTSEDFSAVIRAKQEVVRITTRQQAGGQVGLGLLVSGSSPRGGQNLVGPRDGPTRPPFDGPELQQHGSKEAGIGAPTAMSDEPRAAWGEPLFRVFAQPLPAVSADALPVHTANVSTLGTPEVLQAVRRFAWGGDRRRSIAYIEFGAGELAGAAFTIEAHAGVVSVIVDLPPGASSGAWAQRLAERLSKRGLQVASVQVR